MGLLLFIKSSIKKIEVSVNSREISTYCVSSRPTETFLLQTYSIISAEIVEIRTFARNHGLIFF